MSSAVRRPHETRNGVMTPSKQPLLQPAVDDDRLSRHVAGAVGGEEADDVTELARRSPAAQRDLLECSGVGPPG